MADTVIVDGLPRGTASEQLEQFFDAHGTVLSATVKPFSSYGVVRFADSKTVDGLLGKSLEMEGRRLSLKQMNGLGCTKPLTLKDPAKPLDAPMDVVIARGYCTKTALGSIISLAKGKATVMVLLDRPCAKQPDSGIVATLRKREYKNCVEEEEPDKVVRDKALSKFGRSTQRSALLHFVSDQIRSAEGKFADPLWHADEVLDMQAENHLQTSMVAFAAAVYAKWIHQFRAGLFIILPHQLEAFGPDLGTCNVATHRAVATDSLRIQNKNWRPGSSQESKTSGFTYGLQLPDGDVKRNVVNICKAIASITGVSDVQSEDFSGHPIALG